MTLDFTDGRFVLVGRFNNEAVEFIPLRNHWRQVIQVADFLVCMHHADGSRQYIYRDDPIVITKLEIALGDHRRTHLIRIYCSLECYQQHIRSKVRT